MVLPLRIGWRAKRNQQCNRLRKVFQPFTSRCDSRLRFGGQRDRDARAQGRFQRMVRSRRDHRGVDIDDLLQVRLICLLPPNRGAR
jgi:hypothetical protein